MCHTRSGNHSEFVSQPSKLGPPSLPVLSFSGFQMCTLAPWSDEHFSSHGILVPRFPPLLQEFLGHCAPSTCSYISCTILFHCRNCNQIPETKLFMNNRNFLLTVLNSYESKTKTPTDLVSGEGSGLTWWKGQTGSFNTFIRTQIPFKKAPPSPNYLSKGPTI